MIKTEGRSGYSKDFTNAGFSFIDRLHTVRRKGWENMKHGSLLVMLVIMGLCWPSGADAQSNPSREQIAAKLVIEVVRQKRSRTEGGDFDDKRDHIVFKIKITNPDTKFALKDVTGDFFVFGDPLGRTSVFSFLGKQSMPVSAEARTTFEELTKLITTEVYDDTAYAKFGVRYGGWALILRDEDGKILVAKSSNPSLFLKAPDKLSNLKIGTIYTRDFQETL